MVHSELLLLCCSHVVLIFASLSRAWEKPLSTVFPVVLSPAGFCPLGFVKQVLLPWLVVPATGALCLCVVIFVLLWLVVRTTGTQHIYAVTFVLGCLAVLRDHCHAACLTTCCPGLTLSMLAGPSKGLSLCLSQGGTLSLLVPQHCLQRPLFSDALNWIVFVLPRRKTLAWTFPEGQRKD